MSDEKKAATKDYVVVFDQVDVNTGEYRSQGPGMPPVAVVRSYFRSDTVPLTEEDAARHVRDGAVLPADDKRAKLVQPNPRVDRGVRRDSVASLAPLQLGQTEAAQPGTGAARAPAGTLGTEEELSQLPVKQLRKLATEHGVEVTRGMDKPQLARALAGVQGGTGGTGGQTENPGQAADTSPPEGGAAADAAREDEDHPAHDDDE